MIAAMPRQHFRRYLPSYASICENRWLSRFGRFLQQPNLWCLNRRSVAGGVAVGLFAGLIPGPLQMLGASVLAIPLRVNLPVAIVTTWYTNPFTIGPLYYLAYEYGRLLTGEAGVARPAAPDLDWSAPMAWLGLFGEWLLALGKPLGVGLVALAFSLALAGWLVVWYGWRWHVVSAWRRRGEARRARASLPV
jgi:uncharacterized protein (DUF2062 family)